MAQKLEAEPRITGTMAAGLLEWCRRVVTALNQTIDSDALKAPIDSPTFTGDPKAPTPASSDNDTSVITSAWAKLGLAFSLGTNGYLKLPTWLSGLVIQWGSTVGTTDVGGNLSIPFSISFPTAAFTFIPSNGDAAVGSGNVNFQVPTGFPLAGGGAIHATVGTTGASFASVTVRVNWVAFGN